MQSFPTLAILTGLALLSPPAGPGPEIGQPAPAFTLLDMQGKPHSLADYKGKVVVLEWVNITCPWAIATYRLGIIPGMQKRYAGKDVVWLSMIATARQRDTNGTHLVSPAFAKIMAKDMLEQHGATPTAILIDVKGRISKAYDTRTSMHTFVIDRQGLLVYDGALDDRQAYTDTVIKQNYVVAAVDAALADQPVATAKTIPGGCHPVGPEGLDARWTDPEVYAKASAAEEAADAEAADAKAKTTDSTVPHEIGHGRR